MKFHSTLALAVLAGPSKAFLVPQRSFSPVQVLLQQPNNRLSTRVRMAEDEEEGTSRMKKLMSWLKKDNPNPTEPSVDKEKTEIKAVQEEKPASEPESSKIPQPVPTKLTASSSESDGPAAQAAKLRAEAGKARLEAERMDAELTLAKISKLEKELKAAIAASNKEDSDDTSLADSKKRQERIQDIQKEMSMLQMKMNGEKPAAAASKTAQATSSSALGSSSRSGGDTSTASFSAPPTGSFPGELSSIQEPFSQEIFQETLKYIEDAPPFLLKTLAVQVEMEPSENINKTALAERFNQMTRLDFSFSTRPKPYFTKAQIEARAKELQQVESWLLSENIKEAAAGNETKLALFALEYEYYMQDDEKMMSQFTEMVKDEEWLEPVIAAMNKSAVDSTIESLYPNCMRKENAEMPTMAQVQQFVGTVLPKIPYSATGKAEPVSGGYVIRGTPKTDNGDKIVEAIDKELGRSNLGEKMTVLYAPDFTVFAAEEEDVSMMEDPFDSDPVLYITGPDIVPEARPIQLSVVSGLGLATSWYLSIYPFLLNSGLAKRIDEDLSLVDVGMTPDLSWLTDLSVPLFTTFLGIQLVHELGHLVMAGKNDVKTSVPTFVPSIVTGVTSTVTYFKTLPKNKNGMLEIAVAGPLTGMLASLAAIAVGSQLTMSSDPSQLPALPLEILRQSTLGGGIIEGIMGNGVLNVPPGAAGTEAVAGMTIPLHPVAIAGYIGLVVNALAMLPVGTTDGGRVGLALFGRASKLAIGQIVMITLFFAGILGSDLFLFYFAFLVAFQTGNEIPSRNEVDKVDVPQVAVAGSSFILALLALIPFQ